MFQMFDSSCASDSKINLNCKSVLYLFFEKFYFEHPTYRRLVYLQIKQIKNHKTSLRIENLEQHIYFLQCIIKI